LAGITISSSQSRCGVWVHHTVEIHTLWKHSAQRATRLTDHCATISPYITRHLNGDFWLICKIFPNHWRSDEFTNRDYGKLDSARVRGYFAGFTRILSQSLLIPRTQVEKFDRHRAGDGCFSDCSDSFNIWPTAGLLAQCLIPVLAARAPFLTLPLAGLSDPSDLLHELLDKLWFCFSSLNPNIVSSSSRLRLGIWGRWFLLIL